MHVYTRSSIENPLDSLYIILLSELFCWGFVVELSVTGMGYGISWGGCTRHFLEVKFYEYSLALTYKLKTIPPWLDVCVCVSSVHVLFFHMKHF